VITPANFHEESWYNPLEACFSPLPSTGGEIFPVTVKSQLLREVMNMNPAQIVALALQAAAAVITEAVRKK